MHRIVVADEARAIAAAARTLAWARRSIDYFAQRGDPRRQMMFGIVQGGAHAHLRRSCADEMVALDFPGYAIGGLAVGEPHEVTCEMSAQVASRLPDAKPRYLMGVGRPEQIADYVARGVDMMDCVSPRAARATAASSPGRDACSSRTRVTRRIRAPSTPIANAQRAAAIPAPICDTCASRTKSSAQL